MTDTFYRDTFYGDKGFDSIAFLDQLARQGCVPCIKMKETWRHAIRHPARLSAKENEASHGQKRTLIESLFGNTKQKLTSHIKTGSLRIAQSYALLRLALFNMYYLVKMEKRGLVWVVFRTVSLFTLDKVHLCGMLLLNKVKSFTLLQLGG